jgi:hypothetical protein
MNKNEKLEVAQNYIDGLNILTIRHGAYEIVDGEARPLPAKAKYVKKAGRYFSKEELKLMKKIHDDINDGMKLKLNEDENEATDFDGAAKGKPLVTKARAKMKEKYPDEEDIDDIVGVYFDTKNKDKVGEKAKKVK